MAQNNVMAGLAYLLQVVPVIGWLCPVVIYFIAGGDRFVKFNALQALLLEISVVAVMAVLFVLGIVVGITVGMVNGSLAGLVGMAFAALYGLAGLGFIALWLWSMYNAFVGKTFSIPVIGPLASGWA